MTEQGALVVTSKGSFRLVLIQMQWPKILRWSMECGVKELGWLRVLYGMDIWLGRVPIIRTMAAVNVLTLIAQWMILR